MAQNGESLIVSDTHDDVRHYAISIHDLEGNIIANKRVSAYFGYSRSEILLLNIHDLHPREALEATREAFEQVFKDGFVSFESSFKKKNGQVFPAEISSSLFEVGGKNVIQGIVRDNTEHLKAKKKLQAANEY